MGRERGRKGEDADDGERMGEMQMREERLREICLF